MSNTTLNGTTTTTPGTPYRNYYLGTITLLLSGLTILGNSVTLLVIRRSRSRSLRRPHITLICFLSLVDLLIGALHMLFVGIACFTGYWLDMIGQERVQPFPSQFLNNRVWCKFSSYLTKPLLELALATVAVIGLERIVTIMFPFRSDRWVNNRRCGLALGVAVLIVAALNLQDVLYPHHTVYFEPSFQCMSSYDDGPYIRRILITAIAFNSVAFLIIIMAAIYTTLTILKLKKKARCQLGDSDESSQVKMLVTVTLLILMCFDTSTWLPQYISSTVRHMLHKDHPTKLFLSSYNVRTVVWWLQYLSPALNPLVYALRLKAIRKEIKWSSAKAIGKILPSMIKKNSVSALRVPMLRPGLASPGTTERTEMSSFRCNDVTVQEAV